MKSKSTESESIERRLSNRISDDIERVAALTKGKPPLSTRDLHQLRTSWDLTSEPPGLTGLVGWVRRVLMRLLFPTFKHQSRYTESNSRVVLEIVDRLETLEHTVRDMQSRDQPGDDLHVSEGDVFDEPPPH